MTKTSVSSDKNIPLKAICPGIENLIHFNRWHQTIVNQKSFKAVYDPQKFSMDITEKNEDIKKNAKKTDKSKGQNESTKLKILCLHGYRQTSTSFYEKTGAFRKIVGKKCEMKYINAPHLVPDDADQAKESFENWLQTLVYTANLCKYLFFRQVINYHFQNTNALSFYSSKMILDRPNCFEQVQIVLVGSKSFWSGSNKTFLD